MEESLNLTNQARSNMDLNLPVESNAENIRFDFDDDSLKAVLEMSKRDEEARRLRIQEEEEEFLKIIQLSLIEK